MLANAPKMLPNDSKCFQMLPKHFQMLPNASKRLQMLPNAFKYIKMFPKAPKCIQVISNAIKCCHMLPHASRCSQMLPNAANRYTGSFVLCHHFDIILTSFDVMLVNSALLFDLFLHGVFITLAFCWHSVGIMLYHLPSPKYQSCIM